MRFVASEPELVDNKLEAGSTGCALGKGDLVAEYASVGICVVGKLECRRVLRRRDFGRGVKMGMF